MLRKEIRRREGGECVCVCVVGGAEGSGTEMRFSGTEMRFRQGIVRNLTEEMI